MRRVQLDQKNDASDSFTAVPELHCGAPDEPNDVDVDSVISKLPEPRSDNDIDIAISKLPEPRRSEMMAIWKWVKEI
jgi:hypothetical protein